MLNPNEAPEGCYAVEQYGCEGCCLKGTVFACYETPCDISTRQDMTSVIFKKKPEVESKVEPELINMQDKYQYADGEEARIVMVNGRYPDNPVLSENSQGCLCLHDKYGGAGFSTRDLVKVQPYSEFKRGDKVIALGPSGTEHRRYFSHVGRHGFPWCFANGTTEWTADSSGATPWHSIRRPTPEELGE